MGKLNWWKRGCAVVLLCATTAIALPAQTFTTLHSFGYFIDGAFPEAALLQASDGNLYGTTDAGDANGDGTVFRITPGGVLTTLHSFDLTDGANSRAALVPFCPIIRSARKHNGLQARPISLKGQMGIVDEGLFQDCSQSRWRLVASRSRGRESANAS